MILLNPVQDLGKLLLGLQLCGQLCDVQLHVGSHVSVVHSCVLVAQCCSALSNTVLNAIQNAQLPCVLQLCPEQMDNKDYASAERALHHITSLLYCQAVKVIEDDIPEMLHLASVLGMMEVVAQLEGAKQSFIKLTAVPKEEIVLSVLEDNVYVGKKVICLEEVSKKSDNCDRVCEETSILFRSENHIISMSDMDGPIQTSAKAILNDNVLNPNKNCPVAASISRNVISSYSNESAVECAAVMALSDEIVSCTEEVDCLIELTIKDESNFVSTICSENCLRMDSETISTSVTTPITQTITLDKMANQSEYCKSVNQKKSKRSKLFASDLSVGISKSIPSQNIHNLSPSRNLTQSCLVNNYGDDQNNNNNNRNFIKKHSVDSRKTTSRTGALMSSQGGQRCGLCQTYFRRCSDLVQHVIAEQHHSDTCPICSFQCLDPALQRQHFSLHDAPLPFFCYACEQRFRTRGQLASHVPKHSSSKPHPCLECGRSFKWRQALQAHTLRHRAPTGGHLLCDVCGFCCRYVTTFKAHLQQHTGQAFQCPQQGCAFKAFRKGNLKSHLVTHSKMRSHQCDVCGNSFSLARNLSRHMRLHSTARLRCEDCPFTTTRPDKLRAHRDKKHNVAGTASSGSTALMPMSFVPKERLCSSVEERRKEKRVRCSNKTKNEISALGSKVKMNGPAYAHSALPFLVQRGRGVEEVTSAADVLTTMAQEGIGAEVHATEDEGTSLHFLSSEDFINSEGGKKLDDVETYLKQISPLLFTSAVKSDVLLGVIGGEAASNGVVVDGYGCGAAAARVGVGSKTARRKRKAILKPLNETMVILNDPFITEEPKCQKKLKFSNHSQRNYGNYKMKNKKVTGGFIGNSLKATSKTLKKKSEQTLPFSSHDTPQSSTSSILTSTCTPLFSSSSISGVTYMLNGTKFSNVAPTNCNNDVSFSKSNSAVVQCDANLATESVRVPAVLESTQAVAGLVGYLNFASGDVSLQVAATVGAQALAPSSTTSLTYTSPLMENQQIHSITIASSDVQTSDETAKVKAAVQLPFGVVGYHESFSTSVVSAELASGAFVQSTETVSLPGCAGDTASTFTVSQQAKLPADSRQVDANGISIPPTLREEGDSGNDCNAKAQDTQSKIMIIKEALHLVNNSDTVASHPSGLKTYNDYPELNIKSSRNSLNSNILPEYDTFESRNRSLKEQSHIRDTFVYNSQEKGVSAQLNSKKTYRTNAIEALTKPIKVSEPDGFYILKSLEPNGFTEADSPSEEKTVCLLLPVFHNTEGFSSQIADVTSSCGSLVYIPESLKSVDNNKASRQSKQHDTTAAVPGTDSSLCSLPGDVNSLDCLARSGWAQLQ